MKSKMQNNFWKTLSVILIVVLVVGAVIVFWKNPALSPKTPNYPYYTKAEVDAKMRGINAETLEILKRGCETIWTTKEDANLLGNSCEAICKGSGKEIDIGYNSYREVITKNEMNGEEIYTKDTLSSNHLGLHVGSIFHNWDDDCGFTENGEFNPEINPCDTSNSKPTLLGETVGIRTQFACLCCSP